VGESGHRWFRESGTRQTAVMDRGPTSGRPQALLAIELLGSIRLTWDGRPVPVASRNARALIAALALEPGPRFRETVAAELWPDLPDTEAGSAVRQALWLTKGALADGGVDVTAVLDSDKERIGLRPEAIGELDVTRFEECMYVRPPLVEEAIQLYRGDLAEELNLECFARDRERISDLFEDALAEASQRRLVAGDLGRARDAALRLLRRDPLREEAHIVLIELYGLTGSRSQVSRQYRRLRAILAAELDVEPLPETEAAYRFAIRRAALRSPHDRRQFAAVHRRAAEGAGVFD
jgi:DNA-binding SARP family transcriptional activator